MGDMTYYICLYIYHGTDLEFSPTITVIVFIVLTIPVYRRTVLSLVSFQSYTCTEETYAVKVYGLLEEMDPQLPASRI